MLMSNELHFSKSPLIEAVIDLRVKLPKSVTTDTLLTIQNGREDDYPVLQKYLEGRVEVDATGDEFVTQSAGEQIGYFFVTSDSRQIVQSRLNGFTFSRRGRYESWHSFQGEARDWWTRYRSVTQPDLITRLAVRYINRLELPLPFSDFREYLRTVPDIAPDLPQGLSGYFMQLHIPQPESPVTLILNQAMADVSEKNTVGVILDIDLFQEENIPQNEEGIWSVFESLRDRKNEVFVKCITERMKELIR